MIQPLELQSEFAIDIHGESSTTTLVWQTLVASFEGDLERVKSLVDSNPGLAFCRYDYTGPIHFAVRDGHVDLVRYLIQKHALEPDARNHPFMEPLTVMAQDREYTEIDKLLNEALVTPGVAIERGDTGAIDYQQDAQQRQFEKAVHQNDLKVVQQMLADRPDLALNELSSWGEGVLSVPANHNDREMLELLLNYGARVPDVSKWARSYYFKHEEVAAFLLSSGMNPNHMNWRRVTLLHDMAREGKLTRARLLIDHGAAIDAIDDEYRSTPLGLAVRWGKREMVELLLERGADPNMSGAPWATPLAWAKKKSHSQIEADLKTAGAISH
jgi:ankyrin repeat protein